MPIDPAHLTSDQRAAVGASQDAALADWVHVSLENPFLTEPFGFIGPHLLDLDALRGPFRPAATVRLRSDVEDWCRVNLRAHRPMVYRVSYRLPHELMPAFGERDTVTGFAVEFETVADMIMFQLRWT